jgi:hypothetical protein
MSAACPANLIHAGANVLCRSEIRFHSRNRAADGEEEVQSLWRANDCSPMIESDDPHRVFQEGGDLRDSSS